MSSIVQVLILGLALGGVFSLMGSGLSLIFGVMRIVNLAHPALIIAGAYLAYWAFRLLGVDPIIAMPFAAAIMAVVGVVLYKLVFEREARSAKYSEMTVLLTFAVAMVIEGGLGSMFANTQRVTSPPYATQAIFIGDVFIPTGQLYAGLISLAIIGALALFLKYSRFGYAIRATTQNREAAELLGVNVNLVSMVTFAIGVGLAGAAGALVSFVFSFFPAKHWEWIAVLMSLVVLGGMGSIVGTVVAAFTLSVIAAFVGTFIGSTWSTIVFFLALFVILLVRPQGLFGEKPELA
ncbi:branched-chain amino acid ABC transporter permease [Pelagibacterium halotolerans]|uniref:Inner-membrane translocator n=1 Tax=Pelagibacterium halotolerans (strain DSM 22347 / JCM 15775 / CGMCC 1.7692 / B2) TaxID=1082931 RepID=G4RAZ6_PELHB|nr:branched-chain amino acid ABC transporter permease [Pelagibacterium halotolerans]AEQ53632.1 inner-membrane translocator [Pelagibacterium halotolerans B2]QJR20194.1 branched-chain amino acid ABC transporter permease [Pelagibacterium halotolerans]SEA91228.1 amino acid/amide ABC transporter membrane protein 1, HAAT family [Pelagibacterium halotolerans]